jgi:hypothetical protein
MAPRNRAIKDIIHRQVESPGLGLGLPASSSSILFSPAASTSLSSRNAGSPCDDLLSGKGFSSANWAGVSKEDLDTSPESFAKSDISATRIKVLFNCLDLIENSKAKLFSARGQELNKVIEARASKRS